MTSPSPSAGTSSTELERSIEIAASPAQVWALVSDLPRMASWSPQVVRSTVKGGVRQGARFRNLNRQGPLFWPTNGKVVRFEPHRDFAFRIAENRVIWSFELEPTADGGTRVVHRRPVPQRLTRLSGLFAGVLLGGAAGHADELEEGMATTVARLKTAVESTA